LSTILKNKKVLITAGPTREYWDPVRYLTNASSGAMGIALAQEALRRGANVTLVLGPIAGPAPRAPRLRVVPVVSAWEMYEATKRAIRGTEICIGAAAVVDYRPAQPAKQKLKRHTPTVTLRLQGNPDIIAMVGHLPQDRPRLVVGFALETDHLLEHAREKLFRKRLDWIVANRETNMGQDLAEAVLLSRWGHQITLKKMSKPKLAARIWQSLLSDR
jgi:phosphopantothenoylcysteine decarboxylase/phosphopantothenate--cysteine ligase